MGKKLGTIFILATWFLSAFSQTQPTNPQQPDKSRVNQSPDVVRVNVNLVQVDATVTDNQGRHVSDLKPEDFEVLEDGRPQSITHFSYVVSNEVPKPTSTAPAPIVVTAPEGKTKSLTVAAPLPPVPLRPEQVRRAIALVVDDLGLSHDSSVRVRQSLNKFVNEQMQPGDLVAIIRTGAGMGALQQFTTDKRLLHAAIDRIRFNLANRSEISTFAPIGGNGIAVQINDNAESVAALRTDGDQNRSYDSRERAPFMIGPGTRVDQFREELFSVGTLGALNFVVRGMKELPGRKSVVLFSDGFKLFSEDPGNSRLRDNVERLTDLANRSSIVFYTIDPRGLNYLGISAADDLNGAVGTVNPRLEGKWAWKTDKPYEPNEHYKYLDNLETALTERRNDFFHSQEGLSYLADETGGFFVKNNNDINNGIGKVLNDQNGYYVLGYRPSETRSAGERVRFRKITINVKRPGLHVRTRKGFLDFGDEETRKPTRRTAAEQLFAALTSPFNSGDIALRMTARFGYDRERGPFVESLVHINAHDLNFIEKPDGSRAAAIDIIAVTFGDNGKVIDQDDRGYKIEIESKHFQQALDHGLVYIVTLPIKKPGAYQLRIGVRDQKTERVGSANQFIEVPDVKKGRLTVSGVTLHGMEANASAPNVVAASATNASGTNATDMNSGPAGRLLRAGMVVNYAYFIYNARLDPANRQPKLFTQVRLFRDGVMIFGGKLVPYNPPATTDGKELMAGGSLKLASNLEPGDYVLQVIVVDGLAKSGQEVTSQWVDFEIQ